MKTIELQDVLNFFDAQIEARETLIQKYLDQDSLAVVGVLMSQKGAFQLAKEQFLNQGFVKEALNTDETSERKENENLNE